MKRSTIIPVGVLALAILAVPTVASASNGHAWLLGRSNYETAPTTVSNSKGTPLSLKAKAGSAPLAVNSTKTVTNLSADRLDGLSSASFARSAGKTGIIVDRNQDDEYGAVCPSGTVSTGGGGLAAYSAIGYSGPDFDAIGGSLIFIPNSWVALDAEGYVVPSFVTCYSAKGAVPGASSSMPNPYAGLTSMSAQGLDKPRRVEGNLKASAGK